MADYYNLSTEAYYALSLADYYNLPLYDPLTPAGLTTSIGRVDQTTALYALYATHLLQVAPTTLSVVAIQQTTRVQQVAQTTLVEVD